FLPRKERPMTPRLGQLILALGLTLVVGRLAHTQSPTPPGKQTTPAKPPLRTDLHGDPLPAEALARLGTVRFRNADICSSLVYTPDGRLLVSGGRGGARIYDPATGREVRRLGRDLPNPDGPSALSPDGKLVAVGGWGEDKGGAVYDIATGRQLCRFGKPSNPV